jgi:hypothetical protein
MPTSYQGTCLRWDNHNARAHLTPHSSLITTDVALQKNKVLYKLMTTQTTYLRFQLGLLQYITIVGPLACSLWALESSQANAADMVMFWLAIASTLNELFLESSESTGISSSLAKRVTAIINRRYKSFTDKSPSDIYFTAFFLDPRQQISFLAKSLD